MSFDTLFTLIIIGGMGYMMFKGGGCCGPRGGHGKDQKDGETTDEKAVEKAVEKTGEKTGDMTGVKTDADPDNKKGGGCCG